MTAPVRMQGAGQTVATELLLREVLYNGLLELGGDQFRLDELYERYDDLYQGSNKNDRWTTDHQTQLLEMLQLGAVGGVTIGVGYPQTPQVLPYVSIIMDSGSENPGQAVMGDLLHREYELIGTAGATAALDTSKVIEHSVIGSDWDTQLQIGSWALNGERATLLHSAIKAVLLSQKGRLHRGGVLNVTMSEGGAMVAQEAMPRVGYLPICRVTLSWTHRQTRRKRVRNWVTVKPALFSNS